MERGVEEIIDKKNLEKKLLSGKKLRVKLGIDPTSPNIHIGRSIPLLKLKDFQDLGHKVVFIVGDFTGVIGDTSDKESERPMLSEAEVKKNLKNYTKQAGKIIDLNKCEIRYNSEWLSKLGYSQIVKQANIFSLNEFIARENIKKRLSEGKRVSLRETLYPLMQGYDSVALKADVELGGTDQRFNLLTGREMQRYHKEEPQDMITNPLIEGLDGRKMSSSWGNTINLTDPPEEMYGKVMSLKDELIIRYFTLVTRVDIEDVKKYDEEIKKGANPKDYKEKLAFELVKIYHGESEAEKAKKNFYKVFKEKEVPEDIKEVFVKKEEMDILELLLDVGLVNSRSEGKRFINQKGIKIDGETILDTNYKTKVKKGMIISLGRRNFRKVI